jgi:hypothetical protein
MGLQAIETVCRNPVFVDQDIGDLIDWTQGSQLLEGSRETSRLAARAPATVAAGVQYCFIGAVADKAVCAESKTGAAPTKNKRKIARPNGVSDVETADLGQKQGLTRGREKMTTGEGLDAPQGNAQGPHSASAGGGPDA